MNTITSVFDVTNYGVVGDGETNNTVKIAEIIEKMKEIGGGTIYFPPGDYVTGSIILGDNMTLYLDGGATILGSADPADYPMITKEKLKGYNREGHTGLVAAMNAKNITVTGRGVLDGRGYNWWDNPKNEHRPRAFQPILCENVRLSGISIINSAMWTVHPMCCRNVTIDGISIKNPANSPNTDGINPESCSNVHVSNCQVDVGDDCVTLKSGTEDDLLQKQYPCENITITNCTMNNGHGGVVIGSEMSGGVKNVTISNCVFNGTDRGIRIKTRRKRGGSVEDIRVDNIMMTNVFSPLTINGYYQCGGTDPNDMELFNLEKNPVEDSTPVFKNIYISNVTAREVKCAAGYIYGIPEMPVTSLHVDNFVCSMTKGDHGVASAPIMAWHVEPTKGYGFYCANMKDVSFNNVHLDVEESPSIIIERSELVKVSGLTSEGSNTAVEVKTSKDIMISNSMVSPTASDFIVTDEESSKTLAVSGVAKSNDKQEVIKICE